MTPKGIALATLPQPPHKFKGRWIELLRRVPYGRANLPMEIPDHMILNGWQVCLIMNEYHSLHFQGFDAH